MTFGKTTNYKPDKFSEVKKQSLSNSDGSSGDMSTVERGNWSGKLDFIMSCVSYAVGLGNIWRFPYLCYRNGGAVFLIPYIIFLVVCGLPLFMLETCYGQFSSLSPISVWRVSPLFKGIGYGMVIISAIVCIYYNVIITWAFYFLFKSFAYELPWSTCNNEWNTENCAIVSRDHLNVNLTGAVNSTSAYGMELPTNLSTSAYGMELPTNLSTSAYGMELPTNLTAFNLTMAKKKMPSEEFWENHVLEISDGIEDMGGIRWELFGCLCLSWILVFLCLIRGIKSSGKVVYFTATFPYFVLTALLIRGCTLPGAYDGIRYYIIPQWHKLFDLKVWGEAAMQIFYSVGAAWGAIVTMASYNKFNNNCYRDARIIPLLNCGTSVFAGFVIFSILGFMAHEAGSTIHDVVKQGPGLVFIVYPEVVSRFPLGQIWSVVFFLMLLSIGVGSQIAMFQSVTAAFVDEIDWLKPRKTLLTAALCCAEFLLGIPCVTRGGIYYLQVMDWYSSTFSLMIISFSECMVIAWIYGLKRFYRDIELMIGFQPSMIWKILWGGITPVTILFVLVFSIAIHTPVTYGDYEYPGWAIGCGWIFALCSIVPLPIIALLEMSKHKGSFVDKLKASVKPHADFGPAMPEDRELYRASLEHPEKSREELETMTLCPEHLPLTDCKVLV